MTDMDVGVIHFLVFVLALGGFLLAINQVLLIRRIEAIERRLDESRRREEVIP
jgi:hypothetical protein